MGKGVNEAVIAIDFFCGGGGLSRGLINAGIDVLGGYDNCDDYKKTYEMNNHGKFIGMDIRDVNREQIIKVFPQINGNEHNLLLTGCAPCQPFSSQRRSNNTHEAVNLLLEFARIITELKPAHVFVENVPGLLGKGREVFDTFVASLKKDGYFYDYRVLNAMNFGVPQNRKRLVIIASRLFKPIIPEGGYGKNGVSLVTIRDAISKYPCLRAGESHLTIPNHQAAALSGMNLKRIRATSTSGGDRRSWPNELVLKCHNNGHSGHTDVYGRMDWNKVAPTLTARCFSLSNGRYGHPEQDRAISLREAASIQSFSDNYVFYGNMQSIGKQIGNAVPVRMAEELAKYIFQKARNCELVED